MQKKSSFFSFAPCFSQQHSLAIATYLAPVTSEAEKNRQREIRGLVEACHRFGLKQGMIVTTRESENINMDGIEIKIIPLPEWLLNES